ncbi:MAG: amidohydrolase family protein, partial [Clostridiaceae bacterium]
KRVGPELTKTSYAFKTLDDFGGHISYSTDSPIEDVNPFKCIYTAVTRQNEEGLPVGGFHPEEKVDLYTAIDAYTSGSAYNEHKETFKGRIKEGYLADFIVLDKDIFSIPPMDIKDIKVLETVIGGETVYKMDQS